MNWLIVFCGLVCLVGISGCGVKGDPIPYISTVPESAKVPQNSEERKKP